MDTDDISSPQFCLYHYRIRKGTYRTLRLLFTKDIANEIMSHLGKYILLLQKWARNILHNNRIFIKNMKFLNVDCSSTLCGKKDTWLRVPKELDNLLSDYRDGYLGPKDLIRYVDGHYFEYVDKKNQKIVKDLNEIFPVLESWKKITGNRNGKEEDGIILQHYIFKHQNKPYEISLLVNDYNGSDGYETAIIYNRTKSRILSVRRGMNTVFDLLRLLIEVEKIYPKCIESD